MSGIYSGKSLISYNKSKKESKIVNSKDNSDIRFWKGNILEYNRLDKKDDKTFYFINTPLEDCLDVNTYDKNGAINDDIYLYVDKILNSFTPDISFRLNKENDEVIFEVISAIDFDEMYEKMTNNIPMAAVGIAMTSWNPRTIYADSYEFKDDKFYFYGSPQYYISSFGYITFCVTVDSINRIEFSYEES